MNQPSQFEIKSVKIYSLINLQNTYISSVQLKKEVALLK
jgi:hypothetical protein